MPVNNGLVWNLWYKNALTRPDKDAIIHWIAGEEPFRWTFSSIYSKALQYSYLLLEHGIKKDEVCAIIIRHNKDFYPLYMAISLLGAIPAVLAYPNPRLHPDKFRQGIEGMSQRSGLDWILTEKDIDPVIRPLVDRNESTIRGIKFPLEWNTDYAVPESFHLLQKELHNLRKSTDPLLLQHSSGTTGLQKPVLLSHGAVIEHVTNYAEAIHLCEHDKVVSWLPLYHDMGLIAAFHLPLAFGIPSVQIDPFEWVMIPGLLLDAITKESGTVAWLPNFAYNMMADKIHNDDLEGTNIDSLRILINCSEPVREESQNRFFERFREFGLKRTALAACYAMAETTYAVTQTPPDREPKSIKVDRTELAKGRIKITDDEASSRKCVSSGYAIKGCSLKIVDENRNELPEEYIGEIAISSVSMFDGYRNYPEKTAEVLCGGWYYSGDYGFKYEDEYYIIGRKKDIIIVAGNNLYPEDIEAAVGKTDGVIPGRVVAFGEEDPDIGSEQVSVIVETMISSEFEQKKLKLDIIKAGMDIDVSIRKIYLVPSRWLIKSSAGKPSRKANRERIQTGEEIKWS